MPELIHPPSPTTQWPPRRPRVPRLGALALLSLALGVLSPALAQSASPAAPYADVQRLIATQSWPLAQQRLQQWLQDHPGDPQARLLLGVVLAGQGDVDAARQVYEALIQAYPELPEPHNNLAVLHAAHGRLAEARAALEDAIRANPDYATAHRNLGDVYARLALGHWQRALALQPDMPELRERAQALRSLLQPPVPATR